MADYKADNQQIFVFNFNDLSFVGLYLNTRFAEKATGVFNANIGRYLKNVYFSLCNKKKEYFVMVLATNLKEAKTRAKTRKARDLVLHLTKEQIVAIDDTKILQVARLIFGSGYKKVTMDKRRGT